MFELLSTPLGISGWMSTCVVDKKRRHTRQFRDISTIHRAYYYYYSLRILSSSNSRERNTCESEQNETT